MQADKAKRLDFAHALDELDAVRGDGTTLISLYVPGTQAQLAKCVAMVGSEMGQAQNIKSKQTKGLVVEALRSLSQRLKRLRTMPPNGLAFFCGKDIRNGRQVVEVLEPLRPLSASSLYNCAKNFNTQPLRAQLEDAERFGVVVISGKDILFGTVSGTSHSILESWSVSLPNKHGRGGQSSPGCVFNKRHVFLSQVCEAATRHYVGGDCKCNVSGLVVAGPGELRQQLVEHTVFDPRLKEKIIAVVETGHGGRAGFHEAISRAGAALSNARVMTEKKIVSEFMNEIARDTGLAAVGLREVIASLEGGAVRTVLISNNAPYSTLTLCSNQNQQIKRTKQEKKQAAAAAVVSASDSDTEREDDSKSSPLVDDETAEPDSDDSNSEEPEEQEQEEKESNEAETDNESEESDEAREQKEKQKLERMLSALERGETVECEGENDEPNRKPDRGRKGTKAKAKKQKSKQQLNAFAAAFVPARAAASLGFASVAIDIKPTHPADDAEESKEVEEIKEVNGKKSKAKAKVAVVATKSKNKNAVLVRHVHNDETKAAVESLHAEARATNDEISHVPLLKWLIEHAEEFGACVEVISSGCPEASQFANGLGGLGAILRFPFKFDAEAEFEEREQLDKRIFERQQQQQDEDLDGWM